MNCVFSTCNMVCLNTVYRIPFCPFNKYWLLTWGLSPVSRQKALTWWRCLWPCYINMSTWRDMSVTPLYQCVNMKWHAAGATTATCKHEMTCLWLWPCYTNMSMWHVLGCYTMSKWRDMSVALLHQYVNMTWHALRPITPTCQHDMECMWLFWPTC